MNVQMWIRNAWQKFLGAITMLQTSVLVDAIAVDMQLIVICRSVADSLIANYAPIQNARHAQTMKVVHALSVTQVDTHTEAQIHAHVILLM